MIGDQNKVIYLDIDTLVLADLSELYDIKLDDYLVAGKLSSLSSWSLVETLVTRASLLSPPEESWNMRRALHGEQSLYQNTFNAGVIVMNLERMRHKKFSAHAIELISKYHLNDQDVLNIFGAADCYELHPDWNYVPSQDYSKSPKIIHWAGPQKPWGEKPILWKDTFLSIAQRAPDVSGYTWRGSII